MFRTKFFHGFYSHQPHTKFTFLRTYAFLNRGCKDTIIHHSHQHIFKTFFSFSSTLCLHISFKELPLFHLRGAKITRNAFTTKLFSNFAVKIFKTPNRYRPSPLTQIKFVRVLHRSQKQPMRRHRKISQRAIPLLNNIIEPSYR